MKTLRFYFAFVLILLSANLSKAQDIRQIAVTNLSDIAIASYDMMGPVIYYNPMQMQQVGPYAAQFIMAHEYGHHNLGHIIRRLWNANNPYIQAWLDLNMENEADAYAVNYWVNQYNKAVVQAGYNWFWAINNLGDRTHLPSRVRAYNIAQYYQQLTGMPLFP
jgi:hypothetical protein